MAFSKLCLRYLLPSIFQVGWFVVNFFDCLIAVSQSFHCSKQRGQHWGRRTLTGSPQIWILALLLISFVTLGQVSLPGSLFLHQENKGLGKINTGLDPMIRKVTLGAYVVHGSTLGPFLPLSGLHKTSAQLWGRALVRGVVQRPLEALMLTRQVFYRGVIPSLFSSAVSYLPSSTCFCLVR